MVNPVAIIFTEDFGQRSLLGVEILLRINVKWLVLRADLNLGLLPVMR